MILAVSTPSSPKGIPDLTKKRPRKARRIFSHFWSNLPLFRKIDKIAIFMVFPRLSTKNPILGNFGLKNLWGFSELFQYKPRISSLLPSNREEGFKDKVPGGVWGGSSCYSPQRVIGCFLIKFWDLLDYIFILFILYWVPNFFILPALPKLSEPPRPGLVAVQQ